MILLDESFDDYSDAVGTGPYLVTLVENGEVRDIELNVDLCEQFSKGCTGPLSLQRVTVALETIFDDNIAELYCMGVDGAISYGYPDGSKHGDCR